MTIDNFDLWDMHDREDARWLANRPICDLCEEPIVSECAFRIDDLLICEDCMADARVYVNDLMEDNDEY